LAVPELRGLVPAYLSFCSVSTGSEVLGSQKPGFLEKPGFFSRENF
jgi:hypothetical protein